MLAILVGWVTAFLPSLALAAAAQWLLPTVAQPSLAIDGPLGIVLVAAFAPIVETLIMAAVLSLLLLVVTPTMAVIASSIGWGIAHSMIAPAWGLVIWWPFLVFSTLFVTWRQRSLLAALAIPAGVHALHNLVPALVMASGTSIEKLL